MRKMAEIRIGKKDYPMKMDLNVLEHIQEEYGSINQFERDILGIEYVKDENGKQLYTKDGDCRMRIVEPSVKAIKAVLPMMINEGLAIEADIRGGEYVPVSEQEIFRECQIPFEDLADMIHKEFARCFETKKE